MLLHPGPSLPLVVRTCVCMDKLPVGVYIQGCSAQVHVPSRGPLSGRAPQPRSVLAD